MAPDQPRPTATILVVDDDPFIRATTRAALASRGHTVLEAGDGQAGLDMFLTHAPDLVIVDLKMPVMDGLELLSRLPSFITPRTPILVISGEGGLDEAIEALRLGAWDYLVKPIASASVLFHAVDKALERAALIRENEEHRIHLERQVRERTQELEKANRELELQFLKQQKLGIIGTLAGGMAHDFNNILSSIVFSTELVRGASTSGEAPDQEDLERILRVCQRGTSLIKSVLHFTGKMHEEFIRFPIRETMLETLDIIRGTIPSRMHIHSDLDQNLGTLFGDPVHLQQILMNLVTNSIHALAQTPAPRIVITARAHPDPLPELLITDPDSTLVVISVTDNGTGVADADLPRLCEPFFTTKPSGQGTGLGLFVTQKIVKSLRGRLLFSRGEGEGTTVRVCLPAGPQVGSDCIACLAGPEVIGQGERILVAESDAEVRASVCACLERLRYQVASAASLGQARVILEKTSSRFDLVLTEEGGPEDVKDLCADLKRVNPEACVLLLSSGPVSATLPAGVCRIISRPVDMASLGQTLRHCLKHRQHPG
jgi:signal transduction histidine kinase